MWFNDLIDIRQMAANKEDANSQDIYIRMLASEQGMGLYRVLISLLFGF